MECCKDCKYCSEGGTYNKNSPGDIRLVGYINRRGYKIIEGKAVLLEKSESTLGELPYLEKYCYACDDQLNLVRERWLVEFITGHNKGFKTHRRVSRYYAKGIVHVDEEE